MGQLNQPQQDQIHLSEDKGLTLRDVSLVIDDLVLDKQTLQTHSDSKPGSYAVRIFWDEALVTSTDLLYGETSYPLEEIDSLQILKLHRKRSVIQKKLSNFIAGIVITTGLIVSLCPVLWLVRVLCLILVIASAGYVAYFNWWIEQRRRGEFGLLMTTNAEAKVVITSHNVKAIQTLYRIMFGRLEGSNPAAESLVINMYTGEIIHP